MLYEWWSAPPGQREKGLNYHSESAAPHIMRHVEGAAGDQPSERCRQD